MIEKVKDLPDGAIVWFKDVVIGVKGLTLSDVFNECTCFKVGGNRFDYELFEQDFNEEQLAAIKEAEDEWAIDVDE